MITVYKVKSVPKNMEIIRLNDVYFNKYTAMELDERAGDIIKKIDRSEWIDQYTIKSRLNKIAARWPAKAVAQFYF